MTKKLFLFNLFSFFSFSILFSQLSIPLIIENGNQEISPTSNTAIARFIRSYQGSNADFLIYGYPDTDNVFPHLRKSVMLYATSDSKDMIFHTAHNLRFTTNNWTDPSNEWMRITQNGNIGIGTTSPNSKVQVTGGDIFIEDINKGIIMKSPDGNCWRVTVNNNGEMTPTMISCPNSQGITQLQDQETIILKSPREYKEKIKIYPNPTQNNFKIEILLDETQNVNLQLSDQSGKLLKTTTQSGKNITQEFDIDIFPNGFYFLKVFFGENFIKTYKIQKVK